MEAGRKRSSWLHDVSAGDWIGARLHPFGQDTGSVIPDGFDAYCRIFHPVGETGRWADLARRNHRIVHPMMQLHLISTPPGTPHDWDVPVSWGALPAAPREALVEVLREHTTTPDECWFAVWEGFGGMDHGGVGERVRLPHRSYLLASGPVGAAMDPVDTVTGFDWGISPNLWWPDDRAWIVVTEIDFAWTYFGGTAETIDAVLADDRLEALPSHLSDDPTYNGDVVNAALDE